MLNTKKQKTQSLNNDLQQLKEVSVETITKQNYQLTSQESPKQTQTPQNVQNYRADIDGLRTIAVGIVVIFHAWPLFMPGGFIGVDIFFVISGYLISGIIIKQTQKNKFSYADFYGRRIKRICPALIIVLLFVLIFGSRKLLKRPLQIMTQTMEAAVYFAANIRILTAEHAYFDPETTTNPLLHLWSLGVQQQFYIFWPPLLTIIFSKFQKKALHIISAYTIISFIFSIVCVFKSTQFAFYFPLCRFWQMSVGGIVAYLNIKIQNKMINNFLSLISMTAILTTIWIMNEYSLFPGFWALVPTLGAACIIQAGSQSFVNKYILSSKPFVFIGKISYSLYLWHWPLLVFSRLLYPAGSTSIYAKPEVMVLLALVLSIISYYLIENPFRFRKQKFVPILLFLVMVGISLGALWVQHHAAEFQSRRLIELDEQKQKKIIQDWTPLEEDYTTIKGRRIPNSSKNPPRQNSTINKIKLYIVHRYKPSSQRFQENILQKKIIEGSKYFKPQAKQILHHYEVSNQGQEKQVFIIGDSHSIFVTHRFQKLYENSVQNGKQKDFPTVLVMARQQSVFIPEQPFYNFSINIMKEFKPDRVLFVFRWLYRWRKINEPWNFIPWNKTQQFNKTMKGFGKKIQELTNMGIKVYLIGIKPECRQYDPVRMFDQDGIIESNIKPIRLSDFRTQLSGLYQIFEQVAKSSGAEIVDLTDDMCYNDICHVLTPTGYPVNFDDNHLNQFYMRNWGGAVDYLTQF